MTTALRVCFLCALCSLTDGLSLPHAIRGASKPPVLPFPSAAVATVTSASAVAFLPEAAHAVADNGLPTDDYVVVGIALTLLVLTGLLTASLGDLIADEAQLPSSVNLINKSRRRRSNFLKKGD